MVVGGVGGRMRGQVQRRGKIGKRKEREGLKGRTPGGQRSSQWEGGVMCTGHAPC